MLFAFPWSSLVEGDEQTENSPNVNQEWNVAIHVLQIFLGGGVINTTATWAYTAFISFYS